MHDLPVNVPFRLDLDGLDCLELFTAAGILAARREIAAEAIADLRGHDFTSPHLETVIRAVDRTIRAGKPKNPATITNVAIEHGLIHARHEVHFERLLWELLEHGAGEPGCWQRYAVVMASTLRQLSAIRDRADQLTELYAPRADALDASGAAIRLAPEVADALDAIGRQLTSEAARLRAHVAPIQVVAA